MKAFFIDLAKRVIKTVCETAIGVIGGALILSEVEWGVVFSACGLSAVATVLMNLPNIPLGEKEGE